MTNLTPVVPVPIFSAAQLDTETIRVLSLEAEKLRLEWLATMKDMYEPSKEKANN